MSSKPMSQWDEHELFGEGYLAKRHQPAPVVESSSPRTNEKRKGDDMEHRLARPMCTPDAPPLWRCNAKKQHCSDGIECREIMEKAPTIYPCRCAQCMRKDYPYLEEGPPYITREKNREDLEANYVGLYEPAGYTELEALCVVCGKPIKLDGKTAAKFRESTNEEVLHVACLSSEDAQALHALTGGAYALPYLIRRRADQQEECDGQEDEGEGGGPPGGGGT